MSDVNDSNASVRLNRADIPIVDASEYRRMTMQEARRGARNVHPADVGRTRAELDYREAVARVGTERGATEATTQELIQRFHAQSREARQISVPHSASAAAVPRPLTEVRSDLTRGRRGTGATEQRSIDAIFSSNESLRRREIAGEQVATPMEGVEVIPPAVSFPTTAAVPIRSAPPQSTLAQFVPAPVVWQRQLSALFPPTPAQLAAIDEISIRLARRDAENAQLLAEVRWAVRWMKSEAGIPARRRDVHVSCVAPTVLGAAQYVLTEERTCTGDESAYTFHDMWQPLTAADCRSVSEPIVVHGDAIIGDGQRVSLTFWWVESALGGDQLARPQTTETGPTSTEINDD